MRDGQQQQYDDDDDVGLDCPGMDGGKRMKNEKVSSEEEEGRRGSRMASTSSPSSSAASSASIPVRCKHRMTCQRCHDCKVGR